jgi:tRNA C32,U32 (ribose-2'-O)-methylase TrmJ
MSRGLTTKTGNILLKQNIASRKRKAINTQINGIYQQVEKLIFSINPLFPQSTIKKFVETYQDALSKNFSSNSNESSLKNKIHDIGRLWLGRYGLEIPRRWESKKTLLVQKATKKTTQKPKSKSKSNTKPLNKKQIKALHKEVDRSLLEIRGPEKQHKAPWVNIVQGGAPGLKK